MCCKPVLLNIGRTKKQYEYVACRQCLECRQQRAKMWSFLCSYELFEHSESCFITLTYEKSPIHLVKKDLQDFKKRLRKRIGVLIKTFDCGEYGDLHLRPHFHMIVFGYDFKDKRLISKSNRGFDLYQSDFLEEVWTHGRCTVQEVTENSIAYCALYCGKPRRSLPEHLQPYPEYNSMSRNLGSKYVNEHLEQMMLTDEMWLNSNKINIPDKFIKKRYGERSDELIKIKSERKKKIVEKKYEYIVEDGHIIKVPLGFAAKMEQKQITENRKNRLRSKSLM